MMEESPLNKKAPEGAGYEIEYALLCDWSTENDVNGLDFIGVSDRFHMLKDEPVRKCLIIKMRAVGVEVKRGVPIHIGDLSITIFRASSHERTDAFQFLVKAVAWHHGYYVKTIQIPCAECGDYTVQILDDLVLLHSFSYSVI